MKKLIDSLDATPQKRLVLSIVSDYDLQKSICELIDNALDIWIKNRKNNKLIVDLKFDLQQQTISIQDNAGGVSENDLGVLISPGATTNRLDDFTIGIFGVGTKRAVIALAQDIKITSRHKKSKTYCIEFDDNWLKDDNWHLPYYEVDAIAAGSTIVELHKLRFPIRQGNLFDLTRNLSAIYARFIMGDSFILKINGEALEPRLFDNWAYPPDFEPRRYMGELPIEDDRVVKVEVVAGLTNESSPAGGEYGVYFYCNDRLIAAALKSAEVGFMRGVAGQPHPSISLTRVIVSLHGAAKDMPWNSSKSAIYTNHPTFNALRIWLLELVKNYASLSRRLEGEWPEKVFQFDEGEILDVQIPDFEIIQKSYFPDLPPINVKYSDKIRNKNSTVVKSKPWTKGLYEGVIAVDYLLKQRLETKNRLALVILDSNLEIAFKEFLVNDSGAHYSNRQLLDLFSARHRVHAEIQKYAIANKITADDWKKIKYFYEQRCKLIHEKATVTIADSDLQEFRRLVEKILKILFKLNLT